MHVSRQIILIKIFFENAFFLLFLLDHLFLDQTFVKFIIFVLHLILFLPVFNFQPMKLILLLVNVHHLMLSQPLQKPLIGLLPGSYPFSKNLLVHFLSLLSFFDYALERREVVEMSVVVFLDFVLCWHKLFLFHLLTISCVDL